MMPSTLNAVECHGDASSAMRCADVMPLNAMAIEYHGAYDPMHVQIRVYDVIYGHANQTWLD